MPAYWRKKQKVWHTLTYYDGAGEEIRGVQEEGIYYATLSGKGKNFTGSVKTCIKVQKSDLVEKCTIKNKTKTYAYKDGAAIIPVFGTDFTITVPKGYAEINAKTFSDKSLEEVCLNNMNAGKMALIITAPEESGYAGSKVVYLTIKK